MINSHIIKFAADTSNYGVKKNTNFIATSKNRICGDKITVGLVVEKKKIKKMSYETESCIFCQASASLLSKSVINKDAVISKLTEVTLKNKNFKKLLINKERLNCVMLPFEALKKAINNRK